MDKEEYWSWVVFVLFLLITLDMMTSIYAAKVIGISGEYNVIMKYILSQNIVFIVIIHLVALIMVASFFYALRNMYENMNRGQHIFGGIIEIFIGSLLFFGLFIFANNIAIIILRKDLIGALL